MHVNALAVGVWGAKYLLFSMASNKRVELSFSMLKCGWVCKGYYISRRCRGLGMISWLLTVIPFGITLKSFVWGTGES